MRPLVLVHVIVLISLLAPAAVVQAQDAAEPAASGEEGGTEAATPVEPPPTGETGAAGEEGVDAEAEAFLAGEEQQPEIAAPEEEEGIGWEEPEGMRFWMVGARWRMIMVPRWLLDAFMDFPSDGILPRSVIVNQAGGLEFTTLKDNFAIIGSIWWAGYSSHGEFIANETGETQDPEFIDSNLQALWFTASFMYNVMFTDWVGMNFGASLGLGVVLHGQVTRHAADTETTDGYIRCDDEGDPSGMCEPVDENGHYNSREDGVWPVFPWIDIMMGFRFKVFRHLEINVEGGVGLGFIFGARVNYIF